MSLQSLIWSFWIFDHKVSFELSFEYNSHTFSSFNKYIIKEIRINISRQTFKSNPFTRHVKITYNVINYNFHAICNAYVLYRSFKAKKFCWSIHKASVFWSCSVLRYLHSIVHVLLARSFSNYPFDWCLLVISSSPSDQFGGVSNNR